MTAQLFAIWRQDPDGSDPARVDEIMAPNAAEALARHCEDEIPNGKFPAESIRSLGTATFRFVDPTRFELTAVRSESLLAGGVR